MIMYPNGVRKSHIRSAALARSRQAAARPAVPVLAVAAVPAAVPAVVAVAVPVLVAVAVAAVVVPAVPAMVAAVVPVAIVIVAAVFLRFLEIMDVVMVLMLNLQEAIHLHFHVLLVLLIIGELMGDLKLFILIVLPSHLLNLFVLRELNIIEIPGLGLVILWFGFMVIIAIC
jgi:hypothetical protein